MKLIILLNDHELLKINILERKNNKMRKSKHSGLDVAWYVVDYARSNNNEITNLKLQKILYYIQATSIKKNNAVFFNRPIEAWRHGPVIREVYNYYRAYMHKPITDTYAPINDFTENEKKLMQDVIKKFIKLDEWDLVDKTHNEDPWKLASSNGKYLNDEITIKSMKAYFQDKDIGE